MNNEESKRLQAELERLPGQIRKYYCAYFSELRSQLASPDLSSEVVPDYLKGYKRVISIGGQDGVMVVHFPAELDITFSDLDTGKILVRFPSVLNPKEDTFEFITFPDLLVRDLVTFISGEEDVGVDILSSVIWGTGVAGEFTEPQLKINPDTGQIIQRVPWTRLDFADFNHLYFWVDTERAKRKAKEEISPYIRGLERKELDTIAAPKDIEEARVKAGDRGVVLEVFEHPSPALLVEYADFEGQTKALVTYSTDLETIFDLFVDRDFLANRDSISDQNETIREHTLDFSAKSSVIPGRLVPA